jgi:uncharacterized membrane protein YedE/YeeE
MSTATATDAAAARRWALPRQTAAGVLVTAGVIGFALVLARVDPIVAPLWLLGAVAGFALQRSRFCFASAFRDFFLFGQSRIMRGILVGLAVATVGFAIVMFTEVPFPAFGALPSEAHVLPVGISTVVGGLAFGLGMVLAGGCVSGSLYRMAEGYLGSWVAIGGVVIGLGLLTQTWDWWYAAFISREPMVWLPAAFGYGGGVAITLAALLVGFLGLVWWESRSGFGAAPSRAREEDDGSFAGQVRTLWRSVFVRGWSPAVGGAVLGTVGVLMYMIHMPWGVTGELTRWANGAMGLVGVQPAPLSGAENIGGCTGRATEAGLFTHTFAVTVGLLPGAFAGALLAGEFKWRVPRKARRYGQSLGGGILMGYGAGLAIGCTIGAFFSAIPSLAVSGWVFAAALAGGAFVGTKLIQRIA